jgi:hypothetical protein
VSALVAILAAWLLGGSILGPLIGTYLARRDHTDR